MPVALFLKEESLKDYDFFREKYIIYFDNFHLREKTLGTLRLMAYICSLYYYAVNANEGPKWMMASSSV